MPPILTSDCNRDAKAAFAEASGSAFARQLNLFQPLAEQVPLCERLGFHVWSVNGLNECDCGQEVIGPWNCPERWLPGGPITTCWDLMQNPTI
jgi:hypothetical protein